MTGPRSVNKAFDELDALDGQPVQVEGVLEAHAEGFALLHYPKSERLPMPAAGFPASRALWVNFGSGSLQPNRQALSRWAGKRVRIVGVLHVRQPLEPGAGPEAFGFGPWGLWPAGIEPFSIQRVSAQERRDEAS